MGINNAYYYEFLADTWLLASFSLINQNDSHSLKKIKLPLFSLRESQKLQKGSGILF